MADLPATKPGAFGKPDELNTKDRSVICISCGDRKAVLSNQDGVYCSDCMKIHIVEKMFVQLNALARRR